MGLYSTVNRNVIDFHHFIYIKLNVPQILSNIIIVICLSVYLLTLDSFKLGMIYIFCQIVLIESPIFV